MVNLDLPAGAVPDRVSRVEPLPPFTRKTYAELDGPGCIRHLWVTMTRRDGANRRCVIRIYFDGGAVPFVEAPVGDFFGVMHGKAWYPVNTPFLSIKAESGYNAYFPMPFAESARIEFETGEDACTVYLMADWHRYPGASLREPLRFCARWRREMPTERYGDDFLVLDADGPGRFVGFVYGVRLLDDADRWSHGGGDNVYIDGEGDRPAYLRGIGGEDTFGTSYGGALHPPETHLSAGMPYHVHEDTGEARPAQRLVGYRFFTHDAVPFERSLHMRFGCMRNDVCATAYWYQRGPVRPYFRLPDRPLLMPGTDLPRGTCDLPAPSGGSWWCCGPFDNADGRAMDATLPAEQEFDPAAALDAPHGEGSVWLLEPTPSPARDGRVRWTRRTAFRGFLDFNHFLRPRVKGVAATGEGVAVARAVLRSPSARKAAVDLSWDDCAILRVNGEDVLSRVRHAAFRTRTVPVSLRAGANSVLVKLSNTPGSNHGGWAFAFRCRLDDGTLVPPEAGAA